MIRHISIINKKIYYLLFLILSMHFSFEFKKYSEPCKYDESKNIESDLKIFQSIRNDCIKYILEKEFTLKNSISYRKNILDRVAINFHNIDSIFDKKSIKIYEKTYNNDFFLDQILIEVVENKKGEILSSKFYIRYDHIGFSKRGKPFKFEHFNYLFFKEAIIEYLDINSIKSEEIYHTIMAESGSKIISTFYRGNDKIIQYRKCFKQYKNNILISATFDRSGIFKNIIIDYSKEDRFRL